MGKLVIRPIRLYSQLMAVTSLFLQNLIVLSCPQFLLQRPPWGTAFFEPSSDWPIRYALSATM